MNLLEEYQKLMEAETDNEFPEEMQHDGLSESDRNVYEEVLNKMRADMDKANEEMRKNSKSWGCICKEVNGSIQNKTFKLNEDMLLEKLNRQELQSNASKSNGGNMRAVSEPIGFMVEGFRCPKCGRLMYQNGNMFVCPSGDYTEETGGKEMRFYFVDSTYTKTPLSYEDNKYMCDIFNRAHNKKSILK